MESQRIYVIVAKNLELPNGSKLCMTSGRIAAHACHAVLKMEELYAGDCLFDCDIVILGVPNSADFDALMDRLHRKQIHFAKYFDTDKLWEGEILTALATSPITREHGSVLSDLRPWKCACNDGPGSRSSVNALESSTTITSSTDPLGHTMAWQPQPKGA